MTKELADSGNQSVDCMVLEHGAMLLFRVSDTPQQMVSTYTSANGVYIHHASDSRWFETCSVRSKKHGSTTRQRAYIDTEAILSSRFGVPRALASDSK